MAEEREEHVCDENEVLDHEIPRSILALNKRLAPQCSERWPIDGPFKVRVTLEEKKRNSDKRFLVYSTIKLKAYNERDQAMDSQAVELDSDGSVIFFVKPEDRETSACILTLEVSDNPYVTQERQKSLVIPPQTSCPYHATMRLREKRGVSNMLKKHKSFSIKADTLTVLSRFILSMKPASMEDVVTIVDNVANITKIRKGLLYREITKILAGMECSELCLAHPFKSENVFLIAAQVESGPATREFVRARLVEHLTDPVEQCVLRSSIESAEFPPSLAESEWLDFARRVDELRICDAKSNVVASAVMNIRTQLAEAQEIKILPTVP